MTGRHPRFAAVARDWILENAPDQKISHGG